MRGRAVINWNIGVYSLVKTELSIFLFFLLQNMLSICVIFNLFSICTPEISLFGPQRQWN